MQPAAVLSVLVTTEGVGPTNAKLNSVQSTLRKTQVAGDAAASSVAASGRKLEKAGAGISRFGKAATKYYATPLLVAAGAALYFGQKYEKSMLMVQTHTDTSRKDLQLYKREILEMGSSGKYTQGPSELGEAMYHIASDGYKGVEATTMLRKSADLAMVGQANLAESTYALVSAMKTGIRGTESSGQAINTLNAIVGAGDMKMQELVGAMSTGILPAAKAMGLSLKDVGVAEDIMTQRGVPAQQAAYRLAMTFQMLIPHTEKAEKAFKRLGMGNMSLIETMEAHPKEGLLSALELLKRHLDEVDGHKGVNQIQDIEEIFGGGRTSRGAITLLQNLDSVKETYGRINQLAGETPEKIQQAKNAPVNKLKEALVQVETVLTELGSDLIPMVAVGLSWVAHEVEHVAHWFHSLPDGVQLTIIKFLALTVALAFLIRLVGFFVKSFGMLIQWFAKEEVAAASVISTNEAMAVSYGETAVAAEASAAAQTAAIEEVAAAQKIAQAAAVGGMPIGWTPGQQSMRQIMPATAEEAGQMSMFASAPRTAATIAPEAEAAAASVGGGMAANLATGMAAMLPAALAAIGLGNIIFSILGGDTKGAAEKGGGAVGGAIIGGILGSVVPGIGTIAGALAGAGIGSIAGGLIGNLFGDTGKQQSRYQKQVESASKKAASAMKRQSSASKAFMHVNKQVDVAQKRHKTVNNQVARAQDAVTRAQHRYGDSSKQAARAQRQLNRAKMESIQADRRLVAAEKLHGILRTATMRADKTAIAAIREKKTALGSELHQLEKRLAIVQKEPDTEQRASKEKTKVEEIRKAIKGLTEAKEKENTIVKESATQIGPKFARYLEKIEPHLYGLKKAAHAAGEGVKQYQQTTFHVFSKSGSTLETLVEHFQKVQKAGKKTGEDVAGPFKTQMHSGFRQAGESAKNFEKTTNTALGNVGTNMNKMLKSMGAKPLSFSVKTEKAGQAQRKARGGEISIGAASGDSVHTVLEKGEYVVNREAVKKVGVHKLNELNFGKAPRMMQQGGEVGGGVAAALAEANRIAGTPYVWGGGHGGFSMSPDGLDCSGAVSNVLWAANMLNKPMTSGEFMSWGSPGAGALTIHANPEHVWMEIMGRPYGTSVNDSSHGLGFYGKPPADYVGSFVTRHATGAAMEALKKTVLQGPDGKLKEIGQKSIEHVESAANNYIKKNMPGKFGGGDSNVAGGQFGIPELEALWDGAHGPKIVDHEAAAIAMAESGGNAKAHNPSGATGLWQILGSVVPGDLYNPEVNAANAVAKYNDAGSFAPWEAFTNGAYQQFMQAGGPVEAMMKAGGKVDDKGKNDSIEKSIKSTLKGIGEGKHLPMFQSHLKKVGRRIAKIDLPHSQMSRLGGLTNETEKFSEYANNASSLTKSVENKSTGEEEVVQGVFKGGQEGHWLEQELTSLINLRKQVVTSHEVIMAKTLPQVMKLLKHTQKRLREAQKAIRLDEAKKRELKQKIQDLEKVHNDNVRKIEKEKNELENRLNQAQSAKHPDQKVINQIREEIKSKNEAIGLDKKEAASAIKIDNEKIKDVEKDVHDKKRVEDASKTLITNLGERRTSLYDTMSGLYGQGGEFEGTGYSFYGLEQIQGKGGSTEDIPNPPELGSVGGEIFTVQNRLREIQEELEKKPVSTADDSELKDLEKEMQIDWRKRYLVSQSQTAALAAFPSVGSIASVPKAGSYAIGGLVAATVGERGKEVAVMPTGSRVVPEHDAKEAIGRMGGKHGGINFEEIHFHEADEKVSGRANGEDFEVEASKFNRKQARRSMTKTPGGRKLR